MINIDDISIKYNNELVNSHDIGIKNIKLQDASASNAYHVPNGIMLVYNPKSLSQKSKEIPKISTKDICPSILENYEIKIPNYMSKDTFNI
jgi:predicted AlkP superfamily phosphohydrolase/phosphomutase